MLQQPEDSTALVPSEYNTIQQVVGKFMYYLHIVNPTILVTLNIISSKQAKITETTAKNVVQLINYAATHSKAITQHRTSGIILHIHSDAYCISTPEANIRVGGYH